MVCMQGSYVCVSTPVGDPGYTPGTKPLHAGKISWGINCCTNTRGACIRTRANTGNIFEEFFSKYVFAPSQICILTFAPSVCMDIVTPLMPIHNKYFWELFSVRIHAAHAFVPGRIQENIPGELLTYWFRGRGYSAELEASALTSGLDFPEVN